MNEYFKSRAEDALTKFVHVPSADNTKMLIGGLCQRECQDAASIETPDIFRGEQA